MAWHHDCLTSSPCYLSCAKVCQGFLPAGNFSGGVKLIPADHQWDEYRCLGIPRARVNPNERTGSAWPLFAVYYSSLQQASIPSGEEMITSSLAQGLLGALLFVIIQQDKNTPSEAGILIFYEEATESVTVSTYFNETLLADVVRR